MDLHLHATYGKQSVPVFKILRGHGEGGKDTIIDMVVNIMLEGKENIQGSWLSGDNRGILPTETQKNTCYAVALKTEFDAIEDYAKALAMDILTRHMHLSAADIHVEERRWNRIRVRNEDHAHAFASSVDPVRRTCALRVERVDGALKVFHVRSGIKGVKLLKTTQSGFDGFIRDKYTNLEPVGKGAAGGSNRILSTVMDSWWAWDADVAPWRNFAKTNEIIVSYLLDTFAGDPVTGVYSKSLQDTTYRMASKVLRSQRNVNQVKIVTPNVHFYRYPLEQFSLRNPNVVFQSTDPWSTASGRIETVLSRHDVRRATSRL